MFVQCFKLATRKTKNDGAMTVLTQLTAGISILLLVPFFQWSFPTDWKVWLFLGLAIIFYTINDRLNTTTRKNLDISTENTLRQLSNVFIIIIGIIFFKEDIILMKLLGGLIIIGSNILLVMEKGKFVFNKYIIFQLISVLSFSIAISLDIEINEQFNLPIYIGMTLIIPAILIILFERLSFNKIVNEYKEGNKTAIIITGITWGIAILFNLRAYVFGNVTTVAPISSLNVLINVIVAYLFLKEKDNLFRKIIAAIGIILGILLITFA